MPALAISNEEDDSRIYHGFADGLQAQYPASAKAFSEMAEEAARHRTMLYELYRRSSANILPLIRRQDVRGFIKRKPLWLTRPLGLDEVRKYAADMEYEAARFYRTSRRERARRLGARTPASMLAEEEDKLRGACRAARQRKFIDRRRGAGRRNRAADVRAAICPARPRRIDGRIGLDAGAVVRGGFRHAKYP